MNKEIPNNNTSDEVDLGQFFAAIGRAFDRLFNFIASIFKAIFSLIIYSLKAILINIKIIVAVMAIAAVLGYVAQKMKPKVYSSTMLVRPFFDSKYQLVNNINYYNALISNGDYSTLSSIFGIDQSEIEKVRNFEIDFGPETENEQIKQYDDFKKSIDSASSEKVDFDEFIERRSIYSADLYEIKVSSLKKDIFPKLEEGLSNSFANAYSEKKMEKRDSLMSIQRRNILEQLNQVDSLQNVYINVLKEEAVTPQKSEISFGSDGLSLNKDKTNTKEYELLNQKIILRNELKELDQQKIEDDVFFDVISSFQKTGNLESSFKNKYSIIFPTMAFILLCFLYLASKAIKYTRQYEG